MHTMRQHRACCCCGLQADSDLVARFPTQERPPCTQGKKLLLLKKKKKKKKKKENHRTQGVECVLEGEKT